MSADGFAPCPGRARHTTRDGARDFVVWLDKVPTGKCVHDSCADEVAAFNHELRSRIARAESDPNRPAPVSIYGPGVAYAPEAVKLPKRPPFDPKKLADFAGRCPHPITTAWLRERSPLPVPDPCEQGRATAEAFLAALYQPGERVLIFTRQTSQGDFLFEPGRGSYRLGNAPGIRAVASALPIGGREGVWFLAQPVTGEWSPNPYTTGGTTPPRLGRRHGGCVTSWRYAVLESDTAAAADWLRVLVQIPFPVAAIYTSGGKSVHALLRFDARAKAEWDGVRDALLPVLCPLGADGAALSAVRLSRLPGCLRHGTSNKEGAYQPYAAPRLQELAWLNPTPPARPILEISRP